MIRLFPNAVKLSHKYVAEVVGEGDVVVDATVGNGKDTAFLAGLVGDTGRVIGFETQLVALEKADKYLMQQGLRHRVTLINTGHENMGQHVREPIQACMFNLGYLPGSSHDLVTQPHTTSSAVAQALKLLKSNGIITVVVYTGHKGGAEESVVVKELVASLPQEVWDVAAIDFPNRRNYSPYLIIIQKR